MSTPNLWWVYDSEDRKFSTLPTGPFLVPALIILGLSILWRGAFSQRHTIETLAGGLTANPHWQSRRDRYMELVEKSVNLNGDIDYREQIELKELSSYLHNPYGHKTRN